MGQTSGTRAHNFVEHACEAGFPKAGVLTPQLLQRQVPALCHRLQFVLRPGEEEAEHLGRVRPRDGRKLQGTILHGRQLARGLLDNPGIVLPNPLRFLVRHLHADPLELRVRPAELHYVAEQAMDVIRRHAAAIAVARVHPHEPRADALLVEQIRLFQRLKHGVHRADKGAALSFFQ